jgi:hypothetical protein
MSDRSASGLTGVVIVLLLVVVLAASAAGALAGREPKPASGEPKPASGEPKPAATCGGGCGSGDLDPVLDPRYNVVQAVKQSILLEEHLSVARKRCSDCITKHFLHVVGLLEEAVTLPGASAEECNAWCATAKAYDTLWARWREGAAPDETAAGCRRLRKELVLKYVNVKEEKEKASGAPQCAAAG